MLQHQRWSLAQPQAGNESESPAAEGATGMRTGAELRQARQRLGWSLEEVGDALRIKPAFLQALEDGRPGAVPGSAYALGFLRTYAAALGLNADEVARRFRSEAAEVNSKTKLAFPVPVPDRGVPAGALILIGLVLAVIAYGGWYKLSGEAPTASIPVSAVPARLAPLAPATPSPQVAAIAPTTGTPGATAPQATDTQAADTQAMGTPATFAATGAPAVNPAPAGPVVASVAATGTPAPSQQAAAPTAIIAEPTLPPTQAAAMPVPNPPAPASRIILHATADTWLQVSGPDGRILLSRVLHAGETWPVPSQPGLQLTTGNAGGLVIEVDGTDIPALGGQGVVKHDIPLDPSELTALATAASVH